MFKVFIVMFALTLALAGTSPPDVPQAVAVKFLVKTSKQSYIVGEPILLDLMLQNNGTEELTLFVSDEVEKAVQVNFENQAELPVKKVVTVGQRGGLGSREVFFAPPNGAAHVYLILDRLALLEKPGIYKGTVTVKVEGHDDLSAPFEVEIEDPLEQIASTYYKAWSDGRSIMERSSAVELLSYVRSNYAIKYLESIVSNDNASDDDRMKAAEGFVHIDTKESATALSKLAENEKLAERIAKYCIALAVEWHRIATNDEIKQALKEIAEKYPDARIPQIGD